MVKKSLIALALICMLSTVSYGIEVGDSNTADTGTQIKIDGLWPAEITIEYIPLEICRIPVVIKVGMFIEIVNCGDKITLVQVNCEEIDQTAFPCYKGCIDLEINSNFAATLKLTKYKIPDFIITSWDAYWTSTMTDTVDVPAAAGTIEEVCVEAWDANIYLAAPGEVAVGEIAVTAIPTAGPDICDYIGELACP
jgi:hypothetical protein